MPRELYAVFKAISSKKTKKNPRLASGAFCNIFARKNYFLAFFLAVFFLATFFLATFFLAIVCSSSLRTVVVRSELIA
jgi:hypothetical protein